MTERWSAGVLQYAEMGYWQPDYVPKPTDLLVRRHRGFDRQHVVVDDRRPVERSRRPVGQKIERGGRRLYPRGLRHVAQRIVGPADEVVRERGILGLPPELFVARVVLFRGRMSVEELIERVLRRSRAKPTGACGERTFAADDLLFRVGRNVVRALA